MTDLLTTVYGFRLAVLDQPVLIAPQGENYHDPQVVARSWAGASLYAAHPRCGAHAARWVAVDRDFAELLERGPCQGCAALDQLTIADTEIPTGNTNNKEERNPCEEQP